MNEINEFVRPIIMRKSKYDIKAWIEYKKIIRKCKKLSPSFEQMCAISEFLEIIWSSYMYSNQNKFHLFNSTLPKNRNKTNTCSMIYKEDCFSITFVLYKDTKTINIEIDRNITSSSHKKEIISFIDGQYEFSNIYEQEKFLFITACLMDGLIELISYYFKNKKF